MIRVKIRDLDKHRNETTFRPYLTHAHILRDIGIEFVEGGSYDVEWVGQASIIDKKLPLTDSIEMGVEFCESITGDYMIFDGQDSHSLIGTFEVFKHMRNRHGDRCMCMLKNSLLKNFEMYKIPKPNGRWYWDGDDAYSIPDIDEYSNYIKLSGTNWLSTAHVKFELFRKTHDVCGLFGYPLDSGEEHGVQHYQYYNRHRKPCVDVLRNLKGLDVQTLNDGETIPPHSYYRIMAESKIVIAPFGFGELAPRDIQAMGWGSILIKPSMDYLKSEPWIYSDGQSYIACKNDYSDLGEKIDFVLSNFDKLQEEMFEYAMVKYQNQYMNPQRLPVYLHQVFSELPQIVAND